MEEKEIKIPEFKLKCEFHKKNKIAYCSMCRINICELCLKNHPFKEHNVIPFFEIDFSSEEISEMEKLVQQINSNLNYLLGIKEHIEKLIYMKKNIKGTIIEEQINSENNFKEYYINCLTIIKNSTIIKGNFTEINIFEGQELFNKNLQLTKCNLKNISIVKPHFDWIFSLLSFPSGNLVSVACDGSINIYDINLNVIQSIHYAHDSPITCVSIKDENTFATCSNDGTIKIWKKLDKEFKCKIIIPKAHLNSINKIIFRENGNIISCSDDKTIKFWNKMNDNKYQSIISLNHNSRISSILLLEDKNYVVTCGREETKFYNTINFQTLKTLNAKCGSWGSLKRIDNNRLITGGSNDFIMKIISIQNMEIIKEIDNSFVCWGICVVKNKGIFLTGGMSKEINIFRSDNYENINTIYNVHNEGICGFCLLKNGKVCSYSQDQFLKLWELN